MLTKTRRHDYFWNTPLEVIYFIMHLSRVTIQQNRAILNLTDDIHPNTAGWKMRHRPNSKMTSGTIAETAYLVHRISQTRHIGTVIWTDCSTDGVTIGVKKMPTLPRHGECSMRHANKQRRINEPFNNIGIFERCTPCGSLRRWRCWRTNVRLLLFIWPQRNIEYAKAVALPIDMLWSPFLPKRTHWNDMGLDAKASNEC